MGRCLLEFPNDSELAMNIRDHYYTNCTTVSSEYQANNLKRTWALAITQNNQAHERTGLCTCFDKKNSTVN